MSRFKTSFRNFMNLSFKLINSLACMQRAREQEILRREADKTDSFCTKRN